MAVKKAAKAKAKKNVSTKKTYVAIVLDRSGSMGVIHAATVSGLNEQFGSLRASAEQGGDVKVTLVQFDHKVDTVFTGVSPIDIENWTDEDFKPRGSTAMYDAVWATIAQLKDVEVTDDTAFLVCVISDGEENHSREVSQQQLSDEIKKLQDSGNWTFTFMLANQDIHAVAKYLNVPVANMQTFDASNGGKRASDAQMANSLVQYMNLRCSGSTSTSGFYGTTQQIDLTPDTVSGNFVKTTTTTK